MSERLPRKREFQTDLTQALIDMHDRELDFFESFLYQDKKDSPRGGERHSQSHDKTESDTSIRPTHFCAPPNCQKVDSR